MSTLYITYITIPLVAGAALDCALGEPSRITHPVVLIGRLITFLEQRLLSPADSPRRQRLAGGLLATTVALISAFIPLALLAVLYTICDLISHTLATLATVAASSVLCWFMLAARSLELESMKVYDALGAGDISAARRALSMIVGRDTDTLDEDGITRAAVETVAENASDGVCAPIFFMAILGPAGLYFYKAVNTMDSMIGYKNEKYMHFGTAAARLDDVLNFIPARLTALLMIAAAAILPGYDGRSAARIFARDRKKHPSPNSAQTESACAGALNVRLAGPASYFGKLHEKPYIGDDTRHIRPDDIVRAIKLMYAASALMLALTLAVAALA